MVRDWIGKHQRIVSVFFLVLAALNGWVSYTIFSQHPIMALTNAAMALVLVVGVILTW
jgi:uncharacterized membrane protein